MACFSLLFPLIFSMVARGQQLPDAEVWRIGGIAADVCAVSESAPMFAGDDGAMTTALALTAIAWHESRMAERVQRCTGRPGPSATLWQLEGSVAFGGHTRAELCGDTRLAASRALAMLSRYSTRGMWAARFAGYHDGSMRTVAGDEMAAIMVTLTRRAQVMQK
jgi:hypothetical protein